MRIAVSLIIVSAIVLPSCSSGHEKEQKKEEKKEVIVVSEKVELYNPYIRGKLPDPFHTKNRYRIYTLIDASCASCLAKLRKWNEFQTTLKEDTTAYLIPVCYTKDNFEILKYHFENDSAARLDVPLVLDTGNTFIRQNAALVNSYGEMTVLTDAQNLVLLKGDPLENEQDKEKFIKKITRQE